MKTLYFILLVFVSSAIVGQDNIISVKKKEQKTDKEIIGLYYSSAITQEFKSENRLVSYKRTRQYILFINKKEIIIFHSSLPPQKVNRKLDKKGIKLAEESGTYSRTESSIYFEVKTIGSSYRKTYRYVGNILDENIYLNYKAAYKEKMALDMYLYKYEESKKS